METTLQKASQQHIALVDPESHIKPNAQISTTCIITPHNQGIPFRFTLMMFVLEVSPVKMERLRLIVDCRLDINSYVTTFAEKMASFSI